MSYDLRPELKICNKAFQLVDATQPYYAYNPSGSDANHHSSVINTTSTASRYTNMSNLARWRIELISTDEEGCNFYLNQYKPFRLAALRRDPDAFGSTYDREINFTNDDWLSRIKNPLVKTFVAVRPHDGRVLSATSLIGPLPNPDPSSNPLQASAEMRNGGDQHHKHGNAQVSPLSFQISGVYTTPEARGQGFAKELIKTASEQAINSAKGQDRQLSLSVVVYASNSAAIRLYKSCGFVVGEGGFRSSFNPHKNSSFEELVMHYREPPSIS